PGVHGPRAAAALDGDAVTTAQLSLACWQPDRLVDAAAGVDRAADSLATTAAALRADRLGATRRGPWQGLASRRAGALLDCRSAALRALVLTLAVVRQALVRAARQVGDAQQEARRELLIGGLVPALAGPGWPAADVALLGVVGMTGPWDEAARAARLCAAAFEEAGDRCRAVARSVDAGQRGNHDRRGHMWPSDPEGR